VSEHTESKFLVNALADAIGRQRMLYAGRNGNVKRTNLWDEFGYPDDSDVRQLLSPVSPRRSVLQLSINCWIPAGWTGRPSSMVMKTGVDQNYAMGKVSYQTDEKALGEN
jgi:hypothetical protein